MLSKTACLTAAILLTLSGVWVHWRTHEFRMQAEEDFKDGKLTHDQVERRLLMIQRGGRWLTITGMVLLVASLLIAAD